MRDRYATRRYRRRTSLEPAEIDRWRYSLLMGILTLAGFAGILLAIYGA